MPAIKLDKPQMNSSVCLSQRIFLGIGQFYDDFGQTEDFEVSSPSQKKKAGMQRVRLSTEVPNVELVAADRVYVPAAL